jgi:hypothetical protein
MDYFDNIAALALGSINPPSLEEAVAAYEKEGVTQIVKLWKRLVPLVMSYLYIKS